jgi:signal transduction histidine kinase
VQFDSVVPEVAETSSAVDSTELPTEEHQQEDLTPTREGLPRGFQMRHNRHYVDEVLSDQPMRTVREIAISDLELPTDVDEQDARAVDLLAGSIGRLGVLEPLLVGRHGAGYRVIAGANRLRAARTIGLNTVPCLVHDVDDETLKDMRQATTERVAPVEPARPAVATSAPLSSMETAEGFEFVSALLPAMNAAGRDRLRWSVLADLAGVELLRARTAAVATEILARPELVEGARTGPIDRSILRFADLLDDALTSVATEARLRGVRLDVSNEAPDYRISIDPRLCRLALTGILQALLALSPRGGTSLRVRMQGTTVRPAVILDAAIEDAEIDLTSDTAKQCFDPGWQDHPCGASGAVVLGAVRRVAQLHGGRVAVHAHTRNGWTITLVLPKPLSDV